MVRAILWLLGACVPEERCVGGAFHGDVLFGDGEGRIAGTAHWPSDIPDGLPIEVALRTGGTTYSAVPEDLLDLSRTCGDELAFAVDGLDFGPWSVEVRILDEGDAVVAEGVSDTVDVSSERMVHVTVHLHRVP